MTPSQNASRKFTFDTEFAGAEDRMAPAARARQKRTLTTEEIERLEHSARAEGENTAQARAAENLERALAGLAGEIRAALDESHAEIEALRGEAALLALAMARKLAAAALAALPAADVEQALRQAMHLAIAEPRLTLRAGPAVAAALEPRLAEIAEAEGYEGRVLLAADAMLTGADCRIEWRGGGSERVEAAIDAALQALIAHRFSHSHASVKG
jgi:flagellar assembly protein FliH